MKTEGKSRPGLCEHVALYFDGLVDEPAKFRDKRTRILNGSVQSRIDDADTGISEPCWRVEPFATARSGGVSRYSTETIGRS